MITVNGEIIDDDLVDFVIKEEGFLEKPKNIGDGKITLGSGLTNPKYITEYNKKGKWSKEDNRRAVIEELSERFKWAEKNIPNWTELPDSAKKALLSYKYNYNFTEANSPKLYEALRNRNYREAARQMDATSKDPKFKKGLMERRLREQELFMQDFENEPVNRNVLPPITEPPVSLRIHNPQESTYIPKPLLGQDQEHDWRKAVEAKIALSKLDWRNFIKHQEFESVYK